MGGVLAPTDIADAGLRSRDVAALVHDGTLLRVAPRAYVLAEAMAAAQTPEQRHRLEAMARVHSFAGRVVASHHSALALHGLPFWRVNTGVFHVARAKGTSSRRRGDLVVHEAYPEEISGGAFTSLLRSPATGIAAVRPVLAVIGTALTDGEDAGVVAADAALHRGLMSVEECEAWLGALARRPHLGLARRALSQAEPLTESVGETRTRLLLRSMPGLASITPQFPFRDHPDEEPWAFSDFLVGRRLVVEFDGRLKYRAGYGATTAEVEEIVWREKRREDRIRRHDGGKVVVRVVWDDLDSPSRFRAMIREGLRQVDALPAAA
jgi:hypothetical protein